MRKKYSNTTSAQSPGFRDLRAWFDEESDSDFKKQSVAKEKYIPSVLEPQLELLEKPSLHGTQITWIGHSSFFIQINGKNIITDPVFCTYASPVQFMGPRRFVPPGLSSDDLPKIDLVLQSHNHYDHLDKHYIQQVSEDTKIIVPEGLKSWFTKLGKNNCQELSWWEEYTFQDVSVTAVPAQHFSSRTPFDQNKSHWCGYILKVGGKTIYFAGDTGYNEVDFNAIGARFTPIDIAFIPIGAYEPRSIMRNVHVDPRESVKIHQEVGSTISIAMHWGTFKLTREPLWEPPERLLYELHKVGLSAEDFCVMKFGETKVIK